MNCWRVVFCAATLSFFSITPVFAQAPQAQAPDPAPAALEANASRLYWLTHEDNTRAQTLYNKLAERTRFVHYRKKFE